MLSLGIRKELTMNHSKLLTTAIRTIVGIVLAYGLIHFTLKSTGGNLWQEILEAQKFVLLLGVLCYGVMLGLCIYRWNLLLRVQGLQLEAWDVTRFTMVGVFFNLVLPGSVSGDLIKMAFVARHAKDKKTEAILTVLLDRVLGLFGLFIVASIMVVCYLSFLLKLSHEYRPIQIASFTVGLGSLAGVCGIIMLELHRSILRYSWIARIVDFGAEKLPVSFVSTVKRLINAIELYRKNRGTIALAVVLSVTVHSLLAINLFLAGASIGENVLNLRGYFLAAQVSNAIAAIPLTPAGIGTRDATIALFLKAMGSDGEKAGVVAVIMTWGAISKFQPPGIGNSKIAGDNFS
jgi:uncharacterized protein (TIRG00374 family)